METAIQALELLPRSWRKRYPEIGVSTALGTCSARHRASRVVHYGRIIRPVLRNCRNQGVCAH